MEGNTSPAPPSLIALTPDEFDIESDDARDVKLINSYIKSLPYECESTPEMLEKLALVVKKITICAQSKLWGPMAGWDAMLSYWLDMRYPLPKPSRAALAKLYYEIIVTPGMQSTVIDNCAHMLAQLIDIKLGSRRKLESSDLELSWRDLWRVMEPEVWPSKSNLDPNRPIAATFLLVAGVTSKYYPGSEVPAILDTFLPLFTPEHTSTVITILSAFLPPTQSELYLPILFKLWEATNSAQFDDRMVEIISVLAHEQVAGKAGDADPQGAAEWKDVGIFTDAQWSRIARCCLGSMNVPVGSSGGPSTTGSRADMSQAPRLVKKMPSRTSSLALLLVYSMSVDGPAKSTNGTDVGGYVAGSKALDSLDQLITSIETYFHPSNYGGWTLGLATFLQKLTFEFSRRWVEEQGSQCKTPVAQRLTPAIKRAFVQTLKTPCLLAMFSKDPLSAALAQGALKTMSVMEPSILMPAILERAYSGLESINETHRTTAVMSCLSGIASTLVNEKVWLGGQKHLLPLLELALPGLDINDPLKTVTTTMFIVAAVQNIKIGDLTKTPHLAFDSDAPGEDMAIDEEQNPDEPRLDRDDERSLVRDSTAAFSDWVATFFRRVFAVYENLPEEGGKSNKTGGKSEESVLRSLKSAIDAITMSLSDPLFELVLKLVYDYATSNARANSVKAFGHIVSSLSKARPKETLAKFLPYCLEQIRIELEHGASSVRSTTSGVAAPSDTTLHWNLTIIRNVLAHSGAETLNFKSEILNLMRVLIAGTKNERAFSGTGHLISRVLAGLTTIYPTNSRFVNTDEWESETFDSSHNLHWGRLYSAEDVVVDWHVPSNEEIAFAMQILDEIIKPSINLLNAALQVPVKKRLAIWRNEFCRHLHFVRSAWSGLSTMILLQYPTSWNDPYLNTSIERHETTASSLHLRAGFALEDPRDPRYQKVYAQRNEFGTLLHRAATSLRTATEEGGEEDHLDAVIAVTKAIDVYLLDYGATRDGYAAVKKGLDSTRDLSRVWAKQKEFPRSIWIKRAQVWHMARVHSHSQYRSRTTLDDELLDDIVEFSLSPYLRVRRNGQAAVANTVTYFVRSSRLVLSRIYDALRKEVDRGKNAEPHRLKGCLYTLSNKSLSSYALHTANYDNQFFNLLLSCQQQDKPSIQALVAKVIEDAQGHITEANTDTLLITVPNPSLERRVAELHAVFGPDSQDEALLGWARQTQVIRVQGKEERHAQMIKDILDVARNPSTHWKYQQWATIILIRLIRRDQSASEEVAKLFADLVGSDHSQIRRYAQLGLGKILLLVKTRTFSKSPDELWLKTGRNPLRTSIQVDNIKALLASVDRPMQFGSSETLLVERLPVAVLVWPSKITAYKAPPQNGPVFEWEKASQGVLSVIRDSLDESWFARLATLWSQEGNRSSTSTDMRAENVAFLKIIAKTFGDFHLDLILATVDPMWQHTDKYQQRAAAEILAGLIRGSKHYSGAAHAKLWSWLTPRVPEIFSNMTPDTTTFWDNWLSYVLARRDPRRNTPLVQFILSLPVDFNGDSVFKLSRTMSVLSELFDTNAVRFLPQAEKYVNLYLDNLHTPYAEVRITLIGTLGCILNAQEWGSSYPSSTALLQSSKSGEDTFHIRDTTNTRRLLNLVEQFPVWRNERLPGTKVTQSRYDKAGLTVMLWIWSAANLSRAPKIFAFVQPFLPEILRMSELQDSAEVQMYSSAVLYVLSAVTPPAEFVEPYTEAFIDAVRSSPSWRIRKKTVPVLSVWYFRNLPSLSSAAITRIMDVLVECLKDENVEVREVAASTLSGVLRCSEKRNVLSLKDRFARTARRIKLPERNDPTYNNSLRTLHSAVLGMISCLEAYPYVVEPWMPSLIERLSRHSTDAAPVSTAIRKFASGFKKTHQDTWHTDQHLFDEDQAQALATMVSGTSYYA